MSSPRRSVPSTDPPTVAGVAVLHCVRDVGCGGCRSVVNIRIGERPLRETVHQLLQERADDLRVALGVPDDQRTPVGVGQPFPQAGLRVRAQIVVVDARVGEQSAERRIRHAADHGLQEVRRRGGVAQSGVDDAGHAGGVEVGDHRSQAGAFVPAERSHLPFRPRDHDGEEQGLGRRIGETREQIHLPLLRVAGRQDRLTQRRRQQFVAQRVADTGLLGGGESVEDFPPSGVAVDADLKLSAGRLRWRSRAVGTGSRGRLGRLRSRGLGLVGGGRRGRLGRLRRRGLGLGGGGGGGGLGRVGSRGLRVAGTGGQSDGHRQHDEDCDPASANKGCGHYGDPLTARASGSAAQDGEVAARVEGRVSRDDSPPAGVDARRTDALSP